MIKLYKTAQNRNGPTKINPSNDLLMKWSVSIFPSAFGSVGSRTGAFPAAVGAVLRMATLPFAPFLSAFPSPMGFLITSSFDSLKIKGKQNKVRAMRREKTKNTGNWSISRTIIKRSITQSINRWFDVLNYPYRTSSQAGFSSSSEFVSVLIRSSFSFLLPLSRSSLLTSSRIRCSFSSCTTFCCEYSSWLR